MKIIAFNGSPRIHGNTTRALEIVLEEIRKEDIETELIQVGSVPVHPCQACMACASRKDLRCKNDSDDLNLWVERAIASDGILIGSPVYFGNMTAQTKALIDRMGFVARVNGDRFKRKVGAAVAVNRRAGALEAFHSINDLFLISQMIVVGSSYWNVVSAAGRDEMEKDKEGVETMRTLGRNMAWAVKRLKE